MRRGNSDSEGLSKIDVNRSENEDISESMGSIDTGAIFPTRLGQELSKNAFVVSGYAL